MKINETPLTMLTEENWQKADRRLLSKMLQEFIYEGIFTPEITKEEDGIRTYEWTDREGGVYRFQAYRRLFDSVSVRPETIEVLNDDKKNIPASMSLLLSIQKDADMTGSTTGHLVREYLHTLVADTHLSGGSKTSEALTELGYAELEGEMAGHPWITYNKGRIGFGYEDYLQFAPEKKEMINISWIAVHKDIGTFHSTETVTYEQVLDQELDEVLVGNFNERLRTMDLDPAEYYFMPVHTWQWSHSIVTMFASEIAGKKIVPLGESPDEYLPQQSVRTFVNMTNKEKYHVKLPMSILNTLVYRGLPGERTVIAPEVTHFMKGILEKDSFLKDECRLGLLGEVATMNVDHPIFNGVEGTPYQYLELLGVVFRESIYNELAEGENAITLAALLHIDHEGTPFVSKLIEKSGLNAKEWVDRLVKAILPPLLHYLYQYGTVFSPHGQNTVLVMKDYIPERTIMKDFVDDVNISDQPLPELEPLSDNLKQVLRAEAPEGLTQFILTGLFICHFRYLGDILELYEAFPESGLWEAVRNEILSYQERFPHLSDRYRMFDLLRPSFRKLTLNRNRMFDYGYEDGDDRPHASEFGEVTNALHAVKPEMTNK